MSAVFTAPWQFAIPPGPPIPNFWSVGSFTFDLVTSAVILQGFDDNGNGYLDVAGTGIASGNGFTPTVGVWRFTRQDPSAQGVFSFSPADGVPEPSTVALLAVVGLFVAAAFRVQSRKIRAPQ
ncbi:MAG: PEP-CTERM sorting domain-containing protein [Chthoniobacterales bacterium]